MEEFFDQVDLYFKCDDVQQEAARRPSFSLQKSNDYKLTNKTKFCSEANKNSIKGKYIDKLKHYNSQQESNALNQGQQAGSLVSLSKRQRNRISAKQSRDRKKLYIQLMEYEHKKLQKQLEEVSKQIQETKQKINKFCSQNKTIPKFANRNQKQSRLERLLENSQANDEDLQLILDSISFTMGATASQRLKIQSECYKQIVNLSLPALHRYLMWAATQNKHIFIQEDGMKNQPQEFPCPLLQKITAQLKPQFMPIKSQIIVRKSKLLELITKLWDIKGNLEKQIKNLETSVYDMRSIFMPKQTGKFFLFATKNRFRSELNFFQQNLDKIRKKSVFQPLDEAQAECQPSPQVQPPIKEQHISYCHRRPFNENEIKEQINKISMPMKRVKKQQN